MEEAPLSGPLIRIKDLKPGMEQEKFRARICYRKRITKHTRKNDGRPGKRLFVILQDTGDDSERGKITAVFWDEAADYYSKLVKKGGIFDFRNATIREITEEYKNPCGVTHKWELAINATTSVTQYSNADEPRLLRFTNFANIKKRRCGTHVNIIGRIDAVDDQIKKFTSPKTGRESKTRNIYLFDEVNNSISLTLWGEQAEKFGESSKGTVIAVKAARVQENLGKNLAVVGKSVIVVNPGYTEKLRGEVKKLRMEVQLHEMIEDDNVMAE